MPGPTEPAEPPEPTVPCDRAGRTSAPLTSASAGVDAVVLDSNVVFDWLVFQNPAVVPLVQAIASGQLRWLASVAMHDELATVLARRTLGPRHPDQPGAVLATWRRWAELVAPIPLQDDRGRLRCRDRDDQKFLELALGHSARWLVTRDRALLTLAGRAGRWGLTICTPEQWQRPWPAQAAAGPP